MKSCQNPIEKLSKRWERLGQATLVSPNRVAYSVFCGILAKLEYILLGGGRQINLGNRINRFLRAFPLLLCLLEPHQQNRICSSS